MPLLRSAICATRRGRSASLNGSAAKGQGRGDHVYLVDGSGFLFRAYHALPPLTRKSDGLPTGAVAGYCNMLWKLLEDMRDGDQPTHLAVIFDAGKRTFRNDIYPDYKAQRPEPPDDLIPQFPLVRDATRAFGVPCIEQSGFEADDLIATYARQAHAAGMRVTIVSSDKDLMQLVVDGSVELLDTMKNKRIGAAEVMERFGVPPSKVVDVQALAGDSVDNVPGIKGIGVKTAAELINVYGDLETLLAHAEEIKQPKRRQSLIEGAELARVSRKLVELDDHVDVPVPLTQMTVHEPEPSQLIGFLKAMEFATLTRRAATHFGIDDIERIAPSADPAVRTQAKPDPHPVPEGSSPKAGNFGGHDAGGKPGAVMDRGAVLRAIAYESYECVTSKDRLAHWVARAHETARVCVDTETTSLDAMQASLCGVSLCVAPGEACYIPCGHTHPEGLDFAQREEIRQLS
ncbi:MAG: DNA polymerase I, partial [Alphaproteobacteria bacterium]|nr:DNA polymerase I [Alphaproteobacteria bacterium]